MEGREDIVILKSVITGLDDVFAHNQEVVSLVR